MNIKPPVFKKGLFESVFISEIGWTLKITSDSISNGYVGEIYKGEKLIRAIGDTCADYYAIEKKLIEVWGKIVEIEYNKISQYIEKYGTKEEAREALKK